MVIRGFSDGKFVLKWICQVVAHAGIFGFMTRTGVKVAAWIFASDSVFASGVLDVSESHD